MVIFGYEFIVRKVDVSDQPAARICDRGCVLTTVQPKPLFEKACKEACWH